MSVAAPTIEHPAEVSTVPLTRPPSVEASAIPLVGSVPKAALVLVEDSEAQATVTPPIAMPAVVADLQRLLGKDAVLIPVASRTKRPTLPGWNQVTPDQMLDPQYLARLTENIGVVMGTPSGGIHSIDIDNDRDREPFLAANPQLADTLQTRGERGCNIWFRDQGDCPPLTKLKGPDGNDWGEFRSTGGYTIVHGIHPLGIRYQRLVNAPAKTIEFSSIVWPEGMVLPWVKTPYEEIVDQEGEPIHYGPKGAVSPNMPAVAAVIEREVPLIYEPDEKVFYRYKEDSGIWEAAGTDELEESASRLLKRWSDELYDRRLLLQRTPRHLQDLVASTRRRTARKNAFASEGKRIHVRNGTLDLGAEPPVFTTISPEYRARNSSPIAYDPNATAPLFLGLLGQALNTDNISLVQRVGGAILMGDNAAQRMLVLTGTPGGGKTTVLNVIEHIAGEANVAELRTQHLGSRFEATSYVGKTLLVGKDVPADFLVQSGAARIKALIGNDKTAFEVKGGEHGMIPGNFNVIVTSNAKLRIGLQGDADAWRRRLLVVNYERPKPDRPIANFDQVLLKEEGPGILRFFVEGAIQHLEELKTHGNFRLTQAQQERINEIVLESDSVSEFVREAVVSNSRGQITINELKSAYHDFCGAKDWEPVSEQGLGRQIGDLVRLHYQAAPANDLMGDFGKAARGYRKIAINYGAMQ